MSQWNRLNVHVIKTKRIECSKLNLPDFLAQPQDTPTGKNTSTPRSKLAPSSQPSSQSSDGWSVQHTVSQSSIAESSSFDTDAEDSLISLKTEEDEVFQQSFETPSDVYKRSESTVSCLSLPACLSAKTKVGNETDVCLRPRRLFEEALNLESSCRDNECRSRLATEGNEGLWEWFPRSQELKKWPNVIDNKMNQSRTSPAATINRSKKPGIIADHNNNSTSCDQKRVFRTLPRRRSQSTLDLRSDWEGKILTVTSDFVFGTERIGTRERRTRPRSVTLTGSVYALVKSQDKTKKRDSRSRPKSESKQGMPKFQTSVWDYIKRRSSKRKQNSERLSKENSKSNEKRSSSATKDSEDAGQSTSCLPGDEQRGNVCANNNSNSGKTLSLKGLKTSETSKNSSPSCEEGSDKVSLSHIYHGKWKSTPNLGYSEATEFAERILQRNRSWDELNARKILPNMQAKEFKESPEVLKFLLTTTPELRPMEERLKTLTLSREWLLKELKSLREDDRRLARQFINLRSAIMEIKQAREKEDSDYDSDGEVHKTNRFDTQRRAVDKKERIVSNHGFQMHVTPTRNILSYC